MQEKKELTKKQKIIRTIIVLLAIVAVCCAVYFPLRYTGAWENINTVEKFRDFIDSCGPWAIIVFIIIQFLQVTFLPIPAAVTTVAGATLLFDPLLCALYSFIGIMLGSMFAFWLGRRFGRRIAYFMIGKKDTEKWAKKLGEGKYVFFLMMLFPVFPDDILCIVAGLTDMSWKFYIVTNFISRPIAILGLCYFGSGSVIPFSGYWLILWGVIIVIGLILFYASIKYRNKIEEYVTSLGGKVSSSYAELKYSGLRIKTSKWMTYKKISNKNHGK